MAEEGLNTDGNDSSRGFKWLTASTLERFAVRQTNAGKGKCGYDAACKGLINLRYLDKGAELND